jgi:hypothetical protein
VLLQKFRHFVIFMSQRFGTRFRRKKRKACRRLNTHTDSYPHTNTHTHTHASYGLTMSSYYCFYIHARIDTYIDRYIADHHSPIPLDGYIHTHKHIYTYTYIHIYIYTHIYVHTHTHTHTCACKRTGSPLPYCASKFMLKFSSIFLRML